MENEHNNSSGLPTRILLCTDDQHSDWTTIKPMANEGERLVVVETKVINLENKTSDHETRMRSIEQTIWKAFGATALFQAAIVLIVEWFRK